jgi:hypothetical protein
VPDRDAPGRGAVRGLQKRHRILEYLRHHPEELRPRRPTL